jgi:inner membrane protein
MMIFGHLGIAMGIVKVCDYTISRISKKDLQLNYKVVAIGALLPDLIDKPIVEFIYGLKNHDSHIFAHAPAFSVMFLVLGLILLLIRKNSAVLMLGIATLLHQLLDKGIFLFDVNSSPTLIARASMALRHMGFSADTVAQYFDSNSYFSDVVLYLMVPYVFISEVLGVLILLMLFMRSFKNVED